MAAIIGLGFGDEGKGQTVHDYCIELSERYGHCCSLSVAVVS